MQIDASTNHRPVGGGFTLPVILLVVAALLILAVGILLVASIERDTARSFADRQRAELAAQAALEGISSLLTDETANDDFLVIQSALTAPITAGRQTAPQHFLVRGKVAKNDYTYRYVPMFSARCLPEDQPQLAPPPLELLFGKTANEWIDFSALPYTDKVRAAWLPIKDEKGRTVARYAYWVEDLQGKLDPALTGNLGGPNLTHTRAAHPFPAPGLNPDPESDAAAPLNQIGLFTIEPATTSDSQGTLGKTLIENRRLLLSPDSTLAAAGITPPLVRDEVGRLANPKARAVEESLAANLYSYFERPLIPFVPGIDPVLAGRPRKNLNALLAMAPDQAVNEMAAFVRAALPDFDKRKGGFPEDYLKTLAANTIDYADADSNPTLKSGEYRGLDACPLMSELALQVNYVGISDQQGRKIMTFRFKLFAELFNPTSQRVAGDARLSYEVALPMDGVGAGVGGEPFDSPALLSDPAVATHDLSLIDGCYWTHQKPVELEPNQYRCYLFADVTYRMDVGAASDVIPNDTPFSLNEARAESGLSLMWNGKVLERADGILRQSGLIYSRKNRIITGGFKTGEPETITKAALPGLVYDDYPKMYYNMGDPRMTHYLRAAPLDENAYPENISPNRRNIRLETYEDDVTSRPKVYTRMLPSEWPDGGHNAAVGTWSPGGSDKTAMTDSMFDFPYDPQMALAAPQSISNRGRFYSATELGHIFDPIMHAPMFLSSDETSLLRNKGKMPSSSSSWPDVRGSQASSFYGGGNSLRIGRPEHPDFDLITQPGLHAARLLDIFHAGRSRSENPVEREGPVTRIAGHVNLNTASRDALRAMAAGALVMDPLLAKRLGQDHLGAPTMAPPVSPLPLCAPTMANEADRIADGIIHSRPYLSTADLVRAKGIDGVAVFGNRYLYPDNTNIEWSDAAAEEVFARVYEGSTVRSRNFRVWIVAQALGPGAAAEVLAEVRTVHTLFADPGQRAADGSIVPGKFKITISSSNEF